MSAVGGLNAILSGGNTRGATHADVVSGSALIFPCIDWLDMGGRCSLLCPHCHPLAGGKVAMPQKAYYALFGDVATQCYLTLLTPQDASVLARAVTVGAVKSGMHVQFMDGAVHVVSTVDNEQTDTYIDHQMVCSYVAEGKLTFMTGATRFVFRNGPNFCGLGLLQYHAGMARTPIETQLMRAGFALSEVAKLEDERELRG